MPEPNIMAEYFIRLAQLLQLRERDMDREGKYTELWFWVRANFGQRAATSLSLSLVRTTRNVERELIFKLKGSVIDIEDVVNGACNDMNTDFQFKYGGKSLLFCKYGRDDGEPRPAPTLLPPPSRGSDEHGDYDDY